MSEYQIKSPRKLIEVGIPLDVINDACSHEKTVKSGHPASLHLWWARRPLAAARAVIFCQLVNDPAGLWEAQNPGQRPSKQQRGAFTKRRRELFELIDNLVRWENSTNDEVLQRARTEIRRSWCEVCELNKHHPQADELFNADKMPGLHDPFAGGGSIPMEAQRLGLEAYASDLNPVPVLINMAMIEIPPRFAGKSPVSAAHIQLKTIARELDLERKWIGASGLAEDVRYYGKWLRNEAEKTLNALYPKVEITVDMARDRPDLKPLIGQKLTVISWIWARTVKSSNPLYSHVDVPLAASFVISSKKGKEVYVHPIVNRDSYSFTVKLGSPPQEALNGTKLARGANFRCILSNVPMEGDHIKAEGCAGRMGARLMAIVADGPRGRIYLNPTEAAELIARSAKPIWMPDTKLSEDKRAFWTPAYGITTYGQLFTPRQLVGLTTFSDLLSAVREQVLMDARAANFDDDGKGLEAGGKGATAYSEAISVYLAFAIDKMADLGNSLVRWEPIAQCPRQLFGRQAIPMIWDFAESNPLGDSSGSWDVFINGLSNAIKKVFEHSKPSFEGYVMQADAQTQTISKNKFISSDPPYYDNIGYADLSDFFYIWLRRALRPVYPNLLATIAVPKAEELIAAPYRHGGKDQAEFFFLDGMTSAMRSLANQAHPESPITIYYAFKQSETSSESGTISTGWTTFLEAVHRAGLQLTGTWPLRTENVSRMTGQGTNALASSIVLVCRKRSSDSPNVSRRDFVRELNAVLPEALDEMTKGSGDERSPVAPVDLSQAIIGPGMAVFSKYSAILEADGSHMSVRTALQLINRFLAEDDFDADTQFCLSWFEQNGWKDGIFGDAETLARGKGTSVEGVKDAGVIQSGGGKVRLFKWSEYPTAWNPLTDNRTPIWEALHHLIRALKRDGGEAASGTLLAALSGKAEAIRQLAYRLYTLCERLGQAEDARAYNDLITSWTGIETTAAASPKPSDGQLPGFENT